MHEPTLAGFTVGITADRRWEEQAELLRRRGAQVLHGPTIRTLPMGPDAELRAVTESLIAAPPHVLVANTGIGMRAWFAAADSWGLGEALAKALRTTRVVARGPKASAALHQAGFDVHARAASERLDEVGAMLLADGVRGQRVAFQCHGDRSPALVRRLTHAGATVTEVPVYRWILPLDLAPARQLVKAVVDGTLHAVTFTSAPAVRNLFLVADDLGAVDALRAAFVQDVVAVVVGPVCGAAAHECGVKATAMPERYRVGPMIRTLTERLRLGAVRATAVGIDVVLQGRALLALGEQVQLSEREAALLSMLLAAVPRVVSRDALLEGVWGSGADPHVVEVTVARLRRRLAAASGPRSAGIVGVDALAGAIVTVPRRGYAVRA